MSGYEYIDGDGDKITFESSDPRPVLRNGDLFITISPQKGADDESVILVQKDEFPAFLQGIATEMGLRAAFYDPAAADVSQVAGPFTFRLDRTGTHVVIARREGRRLALGHLEDLDDVYQAAASLLALADLLREKQEAKAAEDKRQEKLVAELASVIQRGNLTRPIAHSEAMRSARMVVEAGWQPPVVEADIVDDEDDL